MSSLFSWLPAWLGGGSQVEQKHLKPIVFHFETIETKHLGVIRRPVAQVEFWSPEFKEWQTHTMLIDTGADYTILPMYMAGMLGLDMSKADTIQTNGIEGARKTSFLDDVTVRLGKHQRTIPVGIAHTSRIPPLMGRHLFFETFHTIFEGSDKVIFSELG